MRRFKRKYVYISLEVIAILAVSYPVIYSVYAGTTSGNAPFTCPPLIPCDNNTPPVSQTCTTFCIVDIQNAEFSPANINVVQGATVEWVNLDSIPHTSTVVWAEPSTGPNASKWAPSQAWNSGVIPPGGHFLLTFTGISTGTYYYQCNIHNQMVGYVNVLPASG